MTPQRLAAIAGFALLGPGFAGGAAYPERPIRFIVPAAAGNSGDISARLIVAQLSKQMGQQFVVDNRPGASGSIAMDIMSKAPADGYTVGTANLLTTGKLLFASSGNATTTHVSAELFKVMTGTNMIHVPFKGSVIALADLTAGRVNVMFDNIPSIGPHVRAGKLRGLAVTTAKRVPAYSDLPTVAEAGVPGYEVTGWGGLIVPPGTPKTIVTRLNAEANATLALPPLAEKLTALGSEVAGGTPEQFAELIRRETVKWAGW